MKLSEKEKSCLRLLTKWSKGKKVNVHRDEVIQALDIDDDAYVSIIKLMDSFRLIENVVHGVGYVYEAFNIKEYEIYQEACDMYGIE